MGKEERESVCVCVRERDKERKNEEREKENLSGNNFSLTGSDTLNEGIFLSREKKQTLGKLFFSSPLMAQTRFPQTKIVFREIV